MKGKRSLIAPHRLKELHKRDGVYVISCGTDDCPCGRVDPGCERGFFSLFIQVVYGIAFAEKNKLPYHVNFGNCEYRYSDPTQGSINFWNYYFLQPLPGIPEKSQLVFNLFNEVYPLRIWNHRHFIEMHQQVVSQLQFSNEVDKVLKKYAERIKGQNVLGVQIRGTDHSEEVVPVSLKRILKKIDLKINTHDKLFVSTDDERVLLLLKNRYGSKLIYNEVVRSGSEIAVHSDRTIKDRYRLGLEVLADCYCLSLCRNAILLHSNISYAALLFNPYLPYTLLERAEERRKRLKTLILFYLDKFGIRKW